MKLFTMLHIRLCTKSSKSEDGYTLLEYCAGAAVIAGVLWLALDSLGANLSDLLASIGDWATERAETVRGSTSP